MKVSEIPRTPGGLPVSGVYPGPWLLEDRIPIGLVGIREGMCPGNNPYRGSPPENVGELLALLREGKLPARYEAWCLPPEGGAIRIFNEDAWRIGPS